MTYSYCSISSLPLILKLFFQKNLFVILFASNFLIDPEIVRPNGIKYRHAERPAAISIAASIV